MGSQLYKIMHCNDVIALANEDIIEIYKPELCPNCFKIGTPIEYWLKYRQIDLHRSNSRQLRKMLRLSSDPDYDEIIRVGHALSITDNWWIQLDYENLNYNDLKSYNESIANAALTGEINNLDIFSTGYTELSTVGSYEKCWRFYNGSWYMYKQGNLEELVSEYYSYTFLKLLNCDVAEYSIIHNISPLSTITSYILSKDFTNNAEYDFEMFCYYFDDNEDIDFIISNLPYNLIEDYVSMIFYDALLFNIDRHNQNVGVLRNKITGKIIKLAPWFDYNLSLVAKGVPSFNNGNLLLRELVSNSSCKEVIYNKLMPKLSDINSIINETTNKVKTEFKQYSIDCSVIESYIRNAYNYITEYIN